MSEIALLTYYSWAFDPILISRLLLCMKKNNKRGKNYLLVSHIEMMTYFFVQ